MFCPLLSSHLDICRRRNEFGSLPISHMLYKATFQFKENKVISKPKMFVVVVNHRTRWAALLSYFLSVVWFKTANQKHLSAVRGATENSFQITESDEWIQNSWRHCIFTHSDIWLDIELPALKNILLKVGIRHQGQACGNILCCVSQESILSNSDVMHAMNHLNSSKSLGCYCLWPHYFGPIMEMIKNTITNGISLDWKLCFIYFIA